MDDAGTDALDCPSDDDPLRALARARDWSATPLGDPAGWGPSVTAFARACLRSRLPAFLCLGPESRILHNEALLPYLGDGRQTAVLGEPAPAALGELWEAIGPMIEAGTAGGGVLPDVPVVLERGVPARKAHVTFCCTPIVAADGCALEGAFCTCIETTERVAAARALDRRAHEQLAYERVRESEAALRAAVDLMGLGRFYSDPTNQAIVWDERLKAMWGLAPDAAVDLEAFFKGIHPDDRERVQAALGQSVDPAGDGVCDIEYRVIGVNGGSERWVASRGKTMFDHGRPSGFHGAVLDISERKRAEQTNLILIAELEHRTRNLLAVVSALAEQTLESCASLEEFVGPFRQRLATLSRVQGLLSRGETSPVTLGELVHLELRALGAEPDGGQVAVNGPEVALPSRSVQILALGLHELATNARKHGALGAPDGRLAVTWGVTHDDGQPRLALEWKESGIAPRSTAADPNRSGFGRTLIEKSLPFQLDAQTRLEIGRENVRCVVSMALE